MSKKLGQRMVDAGLITMEELQYALERQALRGGLLGSNLVLLLYITEDQLMEFLARDTGIRKINLKDVKVPKHVLQYVPLGIVEKYNVIPVAEQGVNDLVVACTDPTNVAAFDHLSFITGKNIVPVLTTFSDLMEATTNYYYGVEVTTTTDEKVVLDPHEPQGPPRIGERLLQAGVITRHQLNFALQRQQRRGGVLGKHLVETGALSDYRLRQFLSEKMGVPELDLESIHIDPSLKNLIPKNLAEAFNLVPVNLEEGKLTVAMMDPTDLTTIDQIQFRCGKEIIPVLASAEAISLIIDQYYRAIPITGHSVETEHGIPVHGIPSPHSDDMTGKQSDSDPDLILFDH